MHPESIANRYIHFWQEQKNDLVPYHLAFDFYEEVKVGNHMIKFSFSASVGVGHNVPYNEVL